jgi:hypothetical protein
MYQIFKLLLEKGCNPNNNLYDHRNVLFMYLFSHESSSDPLIVEILMEHGVNLNFIFKRNKTIGHKIVDVSEYHSRIIQYHGEILNYLLDYNFLTPKVAKIFTSSIQGLPEANDYLWKIICNKFTSSMPLVVKYFRQANSWSTKFFFK